MLQFTHVNGFSKAGEGGNPAGVVLPDQDAALSDVQRQTAAKAIGFSETVFVSSVTFQDGAASVRLRYFTPEKEVDLCGHATIACMGLLHSQGLLSGATRGMLLTRAGDVAFRIDSGQVFMEQLEAAEDAPLDETAAGKWSDALIGDSEVTTLLDASWMPRVVSTGLRDLMVAVVSEEALLAMRPHMQAVADLSKSLQTEGAHVFVLKGSADATTVIPVRNFAPLCGIDEESATGTSNCALACSLLSSGRVTQGTNELVFAQGDCMGSASRITVQLPKAKGERPWVGGSFHQIATKSLQL
eukprot:TRINITY_DN56764_c0_g1_i1.p1 TRINITY_DN56764_c0_g1~~TRINITY_DN56764_c0_g1_i1.p1  ORF type:complete len:300 (+),score=58.64 TRINITY_DN56764_c0_g1_i1:14-913(+)